MEHGAYTGEDGRTEHSVASRKVSRLSARKGRENRFMNDVNTLVLCGHSCRCESR